MNASPAFDDCYSCPGRLICRYLQVTEGEIVNSIVMLGLRTVKEVKRVTGAGEGCTCCHSEIHEILENQDATALVALMRY